VKIEPAAFVRRQLLLKFKLLNFNIMTYPIKFLLAASTLFLATCNNKKEENPLTNEATTTASDTTRLPPVETQSPNTDYKPAFEGQTRIAGVKTRTPYEGKVINKDLKRPWGIAALPDGRLLITQKNGDMVIATPTGEISAPVTGFPTVNSEGQGGLLGITIDPNFTTNRMLYWTFSLKTADGNQTAVAKGRLSSDEKKIENATIIYKALPAYKGTLHYGSRILFDKEGNLVVSTGERSDLETRPQAQSLNSALGKIVRITTDGKPAQGNPFAGQANKKPEIYSYGHRNPQGLAFHPETGDLWENEMGPKGGDELNLIQPGKNYGWPTIGYGIEYSGAKVGGGITQQPGLEQPVYYWDPVISSSGMTFYNGNEMSEWKNNLFIGGMSSKHIIRLVIENNRVTGEERLLEDENQRFRDVAQGSDGALYAITDEGRLYRIARK